MFGPTDPQILTAAMEAHSRECAETGSPSWVPNATAAMEAHSRECAEPNVFLVGSNERRRNGGALARVRGA